VTQDGDTGVTAAILGKKSECLSRSFGAFRTDDGTVQVVCAAGSTCVVVTPQPNTTLPLGSVDAQRFNARLTKVSASRQFAAQSKDGSSTVLLSCTGAEQQLACVIAVSTQAAPAPPPPAQPIVVNPGLYGSLAIAVHDGVVTGSVREGGCEFTIAGQIPTQNPIPVKLLFPSLSVPGTLSIVDDLTVNFNTSAATVPLNCLDLVETPGKLNGDLGLRANISAAVSAFRTVKADKAFFHTTPGSPARPAFVIKGQTVQELGDNDGGFVNVRFTSDTSASTSGFLQASDLVALPFASPGL
jgi:hypothetical protein